ncbi:MULTISPECIES: RNA 2',3'-cyclic phosphodiesterase [Streptomyces]|uniref:RNA 2',3'-cyclic phosphodiesterase n=1 Tax=Streptomyces venezuelae TaxID=54571 RepID=A0A5P2B4S6_STRVZ|nr:RNA 2',3'-cyclic phosphodiesterase [Streptomyces venezuelae]MYY86811.1 RNA 2',3'-cyclic phosphodiesterase [Streptomyces sp. SID335]MYZ16704.1 RNA 2',3'-cyclic phosphodiesterase [Streptomyces sp. SID337]NDZ90808.1 RNA 2',3'-cyclic phosphodiesterase [Streptomyces sp. SID10115]NEA01063.1 RNA 2',3'-cyclic phosphodiesterase [Streptomyces sp. SID10116]NEB46025.1 RNA 2',3'-cyclic phosphodiesterase [Streptomyces sp. SID339]
MTQPPRTATQHAFIALAPPDDAKNELARALEPAYAAHPDLRWNRIEDWHITLAFLGELPVRVVQRLRSPLADLAAARHSLELSLVGGGHFDERVLWSGVEGELEGLHELAEAVRARVRGCDVVFPERSLRPHLTLARARRYDTTSVAAAAAWLDGFTGRRWQTDRLHLVGSTVRGHPGPRRYADIDAWTLLNQGPCAEAEPCRGFRG